MSLKEYRRLSPHRTSVIKRKKPKEYIDHFVMALQSGCSWTPQTFVQGKPDVEVTDISGRGFHGSGLRVIVLNGQEYELVGDIVAGGKTEIVFRRAAIDESIDDGTINYGRLADYFSRKLASGTANREVRVVACSEADSWIVHQHIEAAPVVGYNSARTVIISITGSLVEKTTQQFVIDWYGGSKLTIDRSHAEGDWDLLEAGQWFEATISRKMNGEVVRAMLIGTVDEPEGFSEEELKASYSSIPAANLDPVK